MIYTNLWKIELPTESSLKQLLKVTSRLEERLLLHPMIPTVPITISTHWTWHIAMPPLKVAKGVGLYIRLNKEKHQERTSQSYQPTVPSLIMWLSFSPNKELPYHTAMMWIMC